VGSLNLRRRQLDETGCAVASAKAEALYRERAAERKAAGQQRGVDSTAKRLPRIYTGKPSDRSGMALAAVAKDFGASEASVQRVIRAKRAKGDGEKKARG
jgi:hypothetical protein